MHGSKLQPADLYPAVNICMAHSDCFLRSFVSSLLSCQHRVAAELFPLQVRPAGTSVFVTVTEKERKPVLTHLEARPEVSKSLSPSCLLWGATCFVWRCGAENLNSHQNGDGFATSSCLVSPRSEPCLPACQEMSPGLSLYSRRLFKGRLKR